MLYDDIPLARGQFAKNVFFQKVPLLGHPQIFPSEGALFFTFFGDTQISNFDMRCFWGTRVDSIILGGP